MRERRLGLRRALVVVHQDTKLDERLDERQHLAGGGLERLVVCARGEELGRRHAETEAGTRDEALRGGGCDTCPWTRDVYPTASRDISRLVTCPASADTTYYIMSEPSASEVVLKFNAARLPARIGTPADARPTVPVLRADFTYRNDDAVAPAEATVRPVSESVHNMAQYTGPPSAEKDAQWYRDVLNVGQRLKLLRDTFKVIQLVKIKRALGERVDFRLASDVRHVVRAGSPAAGTDDAGSSGGGGHVTSSLAVAGPPAGPGRRGRPRKSARGRKPGPRAAAAAARPTRTRTSRRLTAPIPAPDSESTDADADIMSSEILRTPPVLPSQWPAYNSSTPDRSMSPETFSAMDGVKHEVPPAAGPQPLRLPSILGMVAEVPPRPVLPGIKSEQTEQEPGFPGGLFL